MFLPFSMQFSPSSLFTPRFSENLLKEASAPSRAFAGNVRMQAAEGAGISRRQLGQIGLGGLAVVGSR